MEPQKPEPNRLVQFREALNRQDWHAIVEILEVIQGGNDHKIAKDMLGETFPDLAMNWHGIIRPMEHPIKGVLVWRVLWPAPAPKVAKQFQDHFHYLTGLPVCPQDMEDNSQSEVKEVTWVSNKTAEKLPISSMSDQDLVDRLTKGVTQLPRYLAESDLAYRRAFWVCYCLRRELANRGLTDPTKT